MLSVDILLIPWQKLRNEIRFDSIRLKLTRMVQTCPNLNITEKRIIRLLENVIILFEMEF